MRSIFTTAIVILIVGLYGCSQDVPAPTAPKQTAGTEVATEAGTTDHQSQWITTPAELREIADRMDAGDSITGSGVFGYAVVGSGPDTVVVEIMKEGF